MNVALDEATADALRLAADRQGITVTGLFESFARVVVGTDRPPKWLREIYSEARVVDVERRSRRQAD